LAFCANTPWYAGNAHQIIARANLKGVSLILLVCINSTILKRRG
jgi:hypothetical protein